MTNLLYKKGFSRGLRAVPGLTLLVIIAFAATWVGLTQTVVAENGGDVDEMAGRDRFIISGDFTNVFKEGGTVELMHFDEVIGQGIVVRISRAYSVVAARRLNVDSFIRDVTRVRTEREEKPVSMIKSIVPRRVGPPVYVSGHVSLQEIEIEKKEISAFEKAIKSRPLADDKVEKISDEEFLARLQNSLNETKKEKRQKSKKKNKSNKMK